MISSVSCNTTPEATSTYPPIPIYPTENYSSELRELKQNQTKWESQHITHYRMLIESDKDGGLPSVTVEVKDGNIVSVVASQGIEILPNENKDTVYIFQDWFTVPSLFSYISQYYLDNPPSMRVIYDPMFGHPTSIYIDPFTEPCCQDFSIDIRDFQILEP